MLHGNSQKKKPNISPPSLTHNNPGKLLKISDSACILFLEKGSQMVFKYSPVFNELYLLLAKLNLCFSNYYFLRK